MGNACWFYRLLGTLDASNWIDLAGIIINSILAVWIVKTIQNRLTNKRVLKDHFITEIKEIQKEFRQFFSELYSNRTKPKDCLAWFKLMNIRVSDLLAIASKKYLVGASALDPYLIELRDFISNSQEFTNAFYGNSPITPSESLRSRLILFEQTNNHLFNEVIVIINDSA